MQLLLPECGEVVEVCRPNLMRMAAASGDHEIPYFLSSVVMAEVHNLPDEVTHAPLRKKQLAKLSKFMDAVIIGCLVWPHITDNPNYDAGEIGISDLSAVDRQFLFTWAMPTDLEAVTTFVHNRAALWELYRMGQNFHARPSALVGIEDAWLAWDFDKAVTALGVHVENELQAPTTSEQKQAQATANAKLRNMLGIKSANMIDSHEAAIAAGFIPMPSPKKESA